MSSGCWKACTVVSDMLGYIWVHRDCAILPTTVIISSTGVMDGFVMYLFLKNIVSDTYLALVEFHRSQYQ